MTSGSYSSSILAFIPAFVIFVAIQLIVFPSTGKQISHSKTTWKIIIVPFTNPLE